MRWSQKKKNLTVIFVVYLQHCQNDQYVFKLWGIQTRFNIFSPPKSAQIDQLFIEVKMN